MERDACTLEQKVLFSAKVGLSFKFVRIHLKSQEYRIMIISCMRMLTTRDALNYEYF